MQQAQVMTQAHLDLQARVRAASKEFAQFHAWCKNPQSRSGMTLFPHKPRINILIRPGYTKRVDAKPLIVGRNEILFHIFGVFDDMGFVADPKYRILSSPTFGNGFVDMIDAKLDRYEPEISYHLYRNNSRFAVRLLYESVRESFICMKARPSVDTNASDYSI